MLTRMSWRITFALVAASLCHGIATADPLDSFQNPNGFVSFGAGGPGALGSHAVPEVLGTRTISVGSAIGAGDFVAIGTGFVLPRPPSGLELATSVFGSQVVTLDYALGGVFDLSTATSFDIDFFALDVGTTGNPTEFTIVLTDGNGDTLTATGTSPSILPPGGILSFAMGSFVGLGDLSNITDISVGFNTNNEVAVDFFVRGIDIPGGSFTPQGNTPEPASMALFGLIGLGGVVAARRKMKKNRA